MGRAPPSASAVRAPRESRARRGGERGDRVGGRAPARPRARPL